MDGPAEGPGPGGVRVAQGAQAGAGTSEDTCGDRQPGGSFRTEAGEEADPAWGSGSAVVSYGRADRRVHPAGDFVVRGRVRGARRGGSAW
ncbi:hypothetical protein GCM10010297_53520 [Streptomyces malachitofuscus]|nr:hypothetical protein GCM10010297_53520 [Streptomyces malachitofuscus]